MWGVGSPLKPGGPWSVVRFVVVPPEVIITIPRLLGCSVPDEHIVPLFPNP